MFKYFSRRAAVWMTRYVLLVKERINIKYNSKSISAIHVDKWDCFSFFPAFHHTTYRDSPYTVSHKILDEQIQHFLRRGTRGAFRKRQDQQFVCAAFQGLDDMVRTSHGLLQDLVRVGQRIALDLYEQTHEIRDRSSRTLRCRRNTWDGESKAVLEKGSTISSPWLQNGHHSFPQTTTWC
jgi:hypothetical protein